MALTTTDVRYLHIIADEIKANLSTLVNTVLPNVISEYNDIANRVNAIYDAGSVITDGAEKAILLGVTFWVFGTEETITYGDGTVVNAGTPNSPPSVSLGGVGAQGLSSGPDQPSTFNTPGYLQQLQAQLEGQKSAMESIEQDIGDQSALLAIILEAIANSGTYS